MNKPELMQPMLQKDSGDTRGRSSMQPESIPFHVSNAMRSLVRPEVAHPAIDGRPPFEGVVIENVFKTPHPPPNDPDIQNAIEKIRRRLS